MFGGRMKASMLPTYSKGQPPRQNRLFISLGLALALALLLLPCAATAQVLYGSLTGNVTDPTGATVPGASVEALNQGTGVHSQTTTDDRGVYRFNNMQAGLYKVTVAAKGFNSFVVDGVQVSNDEVRRVDVPLQIAKTTETMEVRADAVVLQSDKADIEAQVTPQQVEELPVTGGEGKNFQRLLFLVPGAGIIANPEANSEAGNPMRAITVFMNGVSSQANNTKLDGTSVAYPWLPVNVAYVPPPEAIQVVNVSTNAFDAEQGAAGGAAVNVTIKSGTNQLHGVAYENNQNNDLVAVNNVFSHPGRLSKNIFNNYGFAVGGPIYIPKVVNGKNKLFFFMDFMATKRRQYAATPNLTLPNAAMRAGDFSAAGIPNIYDPLTGNVDGTGRSPFPGNKIPTSEINSASATLTALLPALTRPNAYTSNYDAYGGTQYNRNNWDYKVNYNPTDKTMVWGRYSFAPLNIVAPFVLGPAEGDAFGGGNPVNAGGLVQTTATGFTDTISPTMLVDGNVGYTRQSIGANGDEPQGDYGLNTLKIPGTNGVGTNYQGIPGFQIAGVANMGNTNTGSPFKFRDNQYTTAINLTKLKGAHNLRFGFEYDKYALNHFQPQGGTFGTARGTFGFDGTLTALNGGTAVNSGGPFNSWAQFLLGYPSHVGKITQVQNPNSLRFSTWSAYARDQWQVTKNLTINYGLRWEYYPIFSHATYGAYRFDPGTDTILIGGEGGVPWDAGATASKKGFAPRFGVAYRLGAKTVVRSGYGITVDPDNMRNQRNAFPAIVNEDYAAPKSYQFVSFAGVPNSDGSTHVSLSDGIPLPTYPDVTVGTFKPSTTASPTTYLPSTGTVSFPGYMNRGYYQSWNAFVQREISPTLVAEVGYAGTHGVHTQMNVNINGSAPNTGTAGRQLYPFITSDLNMVEPFGDMTYHGLQTQLRKTLGSSNFGINYTFSKAINDANGDNGDASLFRAYPVSYTLDKQLAGFNRTHVFQFFYVYQLPFGKGHTYFNHGLPSWIIGGWQLAGNLSRYSGLPFTVGTSSQINAGGQGATANQVNATVQKLGGIGSTSPWFDGTAFANPPNGVLGTSGRNLLIGPGLFNLDANVSRIFTFREGMTLQLRFEGFNITNTPTFSNPNATCCWVTNATTGAVNYNNFAVITGTASSQRALQVGGYFRF